MSLDEIDKEITEGETTEEYYGGSVDFRLTRMIAENYLMENMEHYDWEGAVIGDYYPLYNPATDKITYLEYKVTKDGADRGYILVTLKDDETGVVESSHGENGTCYELLRDRAGTGEIKAYRFSFASYVAESKNVTRAGERKILAALGNIEYELNGAISGGETLSRSRGAVDIYEELIRAYRDRTAENGGYLDIKKEYGEYLKKQKEDTTRTAPTHKEDKTAEIQWYWDEIDYEKYSGVYTKITTTNTWAGGYYLLRYFFSDGSYQDFRYDLNVTSRVIILPRKDVIKIEILSSSRNGPYDSHELFFGKTDQTEDLILQRYIVCPPNNPIIGVIWEISITKYPLMKAKQFRLEDGVTPCGCTPVAGAIIAAYWDKMKGIDMYPGTPLSESGISAENPYSNFVECVYRFRDHLDMTDNSSATWKLGNAFYWYGYERNNSNYCYYETSYNIDGTAVEYPQSWGNLDEYTYDRLIYCLNGDWPAALWYTELTKSKHSAVIYKAVVKTDSYNNYYSSILSINTGWYWIKSDKGVSNLDTEFTKDLNNVTYGLEYLTMIWR